VFLLGANRALLYRFVKGRGFAVKLKKSPHFFIDACTTAGQFCHEMTNPGNSGGKLFRPSAIRLFLFYVALGLLFLVCFSFIREREAFRLSDLMLGAGFLLPVAIIVAGIFSFLFPIRLAPDGIHAIRWQDIKTVRKFSLPLLPWLRLYDADGSSAVWLAMFQSAPAQFKLELERLAPPASPILSHLK
jgi:hypothetical protein